MDNIHETTADYKLHEHLENLRELRDTYKRRWKWVPSVVVKQIEVVEENIRRHTPGFRPPKVK